MDIARIALSRHTCKAYDPARKIPAEAIEQLITLLRYSPSSVNSQPWHFIVASSDEAKRKIAQAAQQGMFANNEMKILHASHVIVFCARTSIDESHLSTIVEQEDGDGRFRTPQGKETQFCSRSFYVGLHRNEIGDTQSWMEKQVYLALGGLLLGAAALDIDATPIEGFDPKVVDAAFDLNARGLKCVVLASLGYRSADDFNAALPKSRLPEETVISRL